MVTTCSHGLSLIVSFFRVERDCLISLLLVSVMCCSIVAAEDGNAKARPNVIIITVDNHDASVLGFAGNTFLETPNIDRLAREGVYLTNYHCASRCGPSRAALLTGRYHIRSGHIQTPDGRNVMGDVTVPTIARLFQDAGYKTAQYGKWHIGKNYPYRPEDRGFGQVVTFFQGGLSKTGSQHILRHNGKWKPFEGYRIDVWFSELRKFITTNQDKPFMAYLATWATHGGNFGPKTLSKKYRKKMDSLGSDVDKYFRDENTRNNFAELAAEMESIDQNIGRLLHLLDELEVSENTIIVYTSDGAGFKSPTPFMREDRKAYASKVPAIIHWPGGGLTTDEDASGFIANIDIAPTLLDMCGIAQAENVDFDGRSAYGFMHPDRTPPKGRVYIQDHQSRNGTPKEILRPLHFTNVHLPDGTVVSFRDGIARTSTPELEAAARKAWANWWRDVTADFKPHHHVVVGTRHENPTVLRQVYSGLNEQKEKIKNYYFAVEFAEAGTYLFGGAGDQLKPSSVKRRRGNLKIGDKEYAGEFPMKLKIEAGKKFVEVSYDGKTKSPGLTIEKLPSQP